MAMSCELFDQVRWTCVCMTGYKACEQRKMGSLLFDSRRTQETDSL